MVSELGQPEVRGHKVKCPWTGADTSVLPAAQRAGASEQEPLGLNTQRTQTCHMCTREPYLERGKTDFCLSSVRTVPRHMC